MSQSDEALALFIDGVAKVRLSGEARWIDATGSVVRRQDLSGMELEVPIEKMPYRTRQGESIRVVFEVEIAAVGRTK